MKIRCSLSLALVALFGNAETPAGDAAFREYYQRHDAEATAPYGQKQ